MPFQCIYLVLSNQCSYKFIYFYYDSTISTLQTQRVIRQSVYLIFFLCSISLLFKYLYSSHTTSAPSQIIAYHRFVSFLILITDKNTYWFSISTIDNTVSEKSTNHPPKTMAEETKLFTLAEVAKHNTNRSTWLCIHNSIYDVTEFLNEVSKSTKIHSLAKTMF